MYVAGTDVSTARCGWYTHHSLLENKTKYNLTGTTANSEIGLFIINVSCLAFGIGLFTAWGVKYTGWLVAKGVKMPDTHHIRLGGADVSLFMSVILFVIAQIFKRGIEIQSENELTV